MFIFDFLIPKVLFQGSTKYSRDIKVIQIGKTKKLIVNGLVQSFEGNQKSTTSKVWGEITANIIRNVPNLKSVLLLGMGAGTMLKLLNQMLGKNLQTTAVEIDEVIVDIAKKYFEIDKLTNNKIIIADAYTVLEQPENYHLERHFDCIIIDTYLGDQYPDNIKSDKFLENLTQLASDDTFLIFNRVIKKNDTTTLDATSKKLGKFIPNLKIQKVNCPVVSDNYLFFGNKERLGNAKN
ncbi:hypothetical protein HYV31_01000 [candidate division WWE3 bacterium]|nr:hypothetical protein [candidate division WWE3 bacterium]